MTYAATDVGREKLGVVRSFQSESSPLSLEWSHFGREGAAGPVSGSRAMTQAMGSPARSYRDRIAATMSFNTLWFFVATYRRSWR